MDNSNSNFALDIIFAPKGRNGRAKLTARLNGEAIEVDEVNLSKSKDRNDFASRICHRRPGIDRSAVDAELLRIAATDEPEHEDAKHDEAASSADLLAKMPEQARSDADQMLHDPKLMTRILDDVASLGVAGERELGATVYVIGVSRELENPLSTIIQGHSSSGKSYVPEMVARLFPPETILHATQQTPQALFYMNRGSLRHKFILGGERSRRSDDDSADATRALREMISSGKLSKLVTMKLGGRMQTVLVEQDGPIAFVESTTAAKIFDEDANRCILLGTDERPEQTSRILATVAARHSGVSSVGDSQRIIDCHHAAQRMLESRAIVIPYATRLSELFKFDRVEVRRAFPQLMSMIESIALLHQFQREHDADDRLIAAPEDYQLARHLLAKPFGQQLGGQLTDSAARFFERIGSWASGTFNTTEVYKEVKPQCERRTITGWLSQLAENDFIEQVTERKGCKPAEWKLTGKNPEVSGDCPALPRMEDVFPDSDIPTTPNSHW